MATLTNPSEIARETLKQLSSRRLAPSPDNYRSIYNEIAGVQERASSTGADREFKALLQSLPRETPAQQRLARQLDQALKSENWEEFRTPLVDFIHEHSSEADQPWNELVAELLRQWETKQSGLTQARKRESLDRVLAVGGTNSELLFGRLQNLVRSWSSNEASFDDIQLATIVEDEVPSVQDTSARSPNMPLSRASELLAEVREGFAFTLETILATQLGDEPDLAGQAKTLATSVRAAKTLKMLDDLMGDIKRFAYRLEFVAEDRAELRSGTLNLLQLVIENISELVVDDRWLNGQIEIVQEIVAHPLNLRTINDAEQRLKEVIFKQSQLKHSLTEAKEALKQLLAGFIDHLAEFADSTSDYHDKIEVCVTKISQAEDITQLEDVMSEVLRETRIIQLNAQRSRDELRATRQRVEEAERRVSELQAALDKASQLVRHDQLTGALNRRGLDEIYDNEVARARRRQSPLCVALLDIDNFKKLNDSLGHDAGDAALIHLVSVIRDTLRPQDTLARFGGEEFIILLPDTAVDDASKALTRVQRELTRRFFLANNEKVLITFSAGVTEVRTDDTQASAVKRADEAMYSAKKTGKNRVVAN